MNAKNYEIAGILPVCCRHSDDESENIVNKSVESLQKRKMGINFKKNEELHKIIPVPCT